MNLFGDTWRYLVEPGNWQGPGGMLDRMVEQLLVSGTALVLDVLLVLTQRLLTPWTRKAAPA